MTAPAPALDLTTLPVLRPKDVIQSWCSRHGRATDHRWDGFRLVCLDCHPEEKAKNDPPTN